MRRYTFPALAAAVIAVSVSGPATAQPAPCSSTAPGGVGTNCTGVGPGTFVTVDSGSGCTLAFVLRGSNAATYIVTAGHCVVPLGSGTHVWRDGRGPAVRLSSSSSALVGGGGTAVIGHVVYAVQEKDDLDEVDFAVIRLQRGVPVYTGVPYYGGPTSVNLSTGTQPELVNLFGRPPAIGDIAPARTLLAHSLRDPGHAFASGLSAPGDSGAPVVDQQQRAVGILLGIGGNQVTVGTTGSVGDSHEGGVVRILRLAPALAQASRALKVQLSLIPGQA